MSANDRQVGGRHYAGEVQHWDLIERSGIGYLEGCATKYIQRWRKKNGIQDLHKALHYIEKLMELYDEGVRLPRGVVRSDIMTKFSQAQDLNSHERGAINLLCTWTDRKHLEEAKKDVEFLLGEGN